MIFFEYIMNSIFYKDIFFFFIIYTTNLVEEFEGGSEEKCVYIGKVIIFAFYFVMWNRKSCGGSCIHRRRVEINNLSGRRKFIEKDGTIHVFLPYSK